MKFSCILFWNRLQEDAHESSIDFYCENSKSFQGVLTSAQHQIFHCQDSFSDKKIITRNNISNNKKHLLSLGIQLIPTSNIMLGLWKFTLLRTE